MATRDDPAEVARFLAWQASQARQAAATAARARALSGSRLARVRLADAWAPIAPDPRFPEQTPQNGA